MAIAKLWDYPPYPYLEQVLNHCYKAGSIYLFLWKERDKNNCVHIKKQEISSRTLMNRVAFDHNIRLLVKEGLVSVYEKSDEIGIELVDWREDEIY